MTQKKSLFFFFALFSLFVLNAQSVDQTLSRADSLFENGEQDKACELYNAASKVNPKDPRPLKGIAYCLFNAGDYEKCNSTIDQALKRKPALESESHLYYLKGACYYQWSKWAEAVKYFTKFLSLNLDRYDVFVVRGFAYFSDGKYQEAISDFEYSLKDPQLTSESQANSFALMGTCYQHLNDPINALKYAQLSAYHDSTNTNSLLLNGELFYGAGKYSEAFHVYQKLYNNDTTDNFSLFRMSYSLSQMKQYEKAIEGYKKFYVKVPDSEDAPNYLAWTLFLAGRFDEALPYAHKSLELNKNDANAYDTRGCIYYGLKEYNKAIADLTVSINKNKKSDNSYYYRALCYLQLKKIREACADLKKVIEFPEYQTPQAEVPAQELLNTHCKN